MSDLLSYRVFVDTNLLINDYLFRVEKRENSRVAANALFYLRSKSRVNLYIASFSIIQLVSTLSRGKISDVNIRAELRYVQEHYTIVDFTNADIKQGLALPGKDVEDGFQYAVSKKMKCRYILTDNVKDFTVFDDVVIVKPAKIRKIILL
jgi:predicted nucleic-acid-binding protein